MISVFAVAIHEPILLRLAHACAERAIVESFAALETCQQRFAEACADVIVLGSPLELQEALQWRDEVRASPRGALLPLWVWISDGSDAAAALAAGFDGVLCAPQENRHHAFFDGVLMRVQHLQQLQQQWRDNEQFVTWLLGNLDEYAVLIQFMRALNEAESFDSIAEALLRLLQGYHLTGELELRLPEGVLWRSSAEAVPERDKLILEQLRLLSDRIFEFRSRSVFNFEQLTLLVSDMPLDDPDRRGRLRDHLAVACEMAQARLRSLLGQRKLMSTQGGLSDVLREIEALTETSMQQLRTIRLQGLEQVRELRERLMVAFVPLGLSEEMEEMIAELIDKRTQALLELYEQGSDVGAFERIATRLKAILHQMS